MEEALTQKGTKVTKARVTDTIQEETAMLEVQLESLKHNYEGWIKMALLEQLQMNETDLQMGLEILDPVQKEPQSLLMAIEEDPSQRGATKTAMMQQLGKALEDDYIKLKSNLCLLGCQTSTGRACRREAHQSVSPPNMGPAASALIKGRLPSLRTLVEHKEEHTDHLPHCSTTNLAFYQEQMELAQQARDLTHRVYKEAEADGNPEVEQFLQLCD